MKTLTRWLLLVALLLSPLAMQQAAAAQLQGHAVTSTAMPGHCDSGPSPKAHVPGDCAMGCASALPAADLTPLDAPTLAPMAVQEAQVAFLANRILQVATPPPRSR